MNKQELENKLKQIKEISETIIEQLESFAFDNTSFTFNLNELLSKDTQTINLKITNYNDLPKNTLIKQIISDDTNHQIVLKETILNTIDIKEKETRDYPIELQFYCVNYLFPGKYKLNCVIYNNTVQLYFPFSIDIEIFDEVKEKKRKTVAY